MTDRATPPAEGPAAPDSPSSPDAANVAAVSAAVLGAALTIGALALFGTRAALSVGAGATIAVANLVTMSAIIRAMLRPGDDAEAEVDADAKADEVSADHVAEGKRGGAAWGAFALLKILLLFGGVWLLLTRGVVDPIALVVGYGVLPVGITVGGLVTSLDPRSRRAGRRSRTK